jgi:hypothetical protein
MMNQLIAWSLSNRIRVLAGAVVLIGAATLVALRLPVDVFPDLTAPTVTVLTEAHGMAPEEIETQVAIPIESAVNGATGVRRVREFVDERLHEKAVLRRRHGAPRAGPEVLRRGDRADIPIVHGIGRGGRRDVRQA